MKAVAPTPKTGKWIKRILFFSLIPLLLFLAFCGLYIYVYILGKPLGSANLVHTDPCGNGEYRILVYEYHNGDGYVSLTNRDGKIFDTAKFSRGIPPAPFRWKKSCKEVLVGSDDGLIYLKAK